MNEILNAMGLNELLKQVIRRQTQQSEQAKLQKEEDYKKRCKEFLQYFRKLKVRHSKIMKRNNPNIWTKVNFNPASFDKKNEFDFRNYRFITECSKKKKGQGY